MEKLDFEQIIEILKEELGDDASGISDFSHGAFGSHKFPEAKWNTPEYKEMIHEKLGEWCEIEEAATGGEGKGENWNRVFHFKDHNVYIKVHGYYSSYNGTEFDDGWDCCSQVVPTQKTITVYE